MTFTIVGGKKCTVPSRSRGSDVVKKFLMVTPQQPKGKLMPVVYETRGNDLLSYDAETKFPTIPLMNGYVESGEKAKVITVTYDSDAHRHNLDLFREELAALAKRKGFEYEIESIDLPFDDSVGAMVEIFRQYLDRIEDDDILHACITFGSKPIPIAMTMAMRYACRIRKNVSIECIVYGQRDWSTTPATNRIYDVTALTDLDELARVLADQRVADPAAVIRQVIEM